MSWPVLAASYVCFCMTNSSYHAAFLQVPEPHANGGEPPWRWVQNLGAQLMQHDWRHAFYSMSVLFWIVAVCFYLTICFRIALHMQQVMCNLIQTVF